MTRLKAIGTGVTTAMKLKALVAEKKARLKAEEEEAQALAVAQKAEASEMRRAHAEARRAAASLLQQCWNSRVARRRARAERAAAHQAERAARAAHKAEQQMREADALTPSPQLPSCSVRWHGRLGRSDWPIAVLAAPTSELARPGFSRVNASEYVDSASVLQAKVFAVASILRRSQHSVIYSGAGMSTAAGVPDLASKARGSIAPHLAAQQHLCARTPDVHVGMPDARWHRSAGGGVPWAKGAFGGSVNRLDAKPSLSHRALASLERSGFIHHCVTLNHDRLAQKAGFPQHRLNEVAGAWGDDYNPVVPLDKPGDCGECFRRDLLDAMQEQAERAECVLAVGTSLPGICSDSVAQRVADQPDGHHHLVLVTLQQTRLDEACAVRVWALCDDFFALLADELRVPLPDRVCEQRGELWVDEHPRCRYRTPKPRATPKH